MKFTIDSEGIALDAETIIDLQRFEVQARCAVVLTRHGDVLAVDKYPDNKPTMQHVANMTYGCLMLLEPARQVVGPILINSGFRNARVNALVGGVKNSQHQDIMLE